MKRDKSVTEQVLDPRRNDIGNIGAAMVAAAKVKEQASDYPEETLENKLLKVLGR